MAQGLENDGDWFNIFGLKQEQNIVAYNNKQKKCNRSFGMVKRSNNKKVQQYLIKT
jgi:hypothetical protein